MVIDSIIALRQESGIDFGETYADLLHCYKDYERYGYLKYIWEDGELKGFVDWLRLQRLPDRRHFTWKDMPMIGRGEYIYVSTICVKEKKYFWRLLRMVRAIEDKRGGYKWIVWHGIDGAMKVYRNMKGVFENV